LTLDAAYCEQAIARHFRNFAQRFHENAEWPPLPR
jgi:hypothetical protein